MGVIAATDRADGARHLRVTAVLEAREVEELAPLVDVRPKTVLKLLLDPTQRGRVAKRVQVREHPHHARETVYLVVAGSGEWVGQGVGNRE